MITVLACRGIGEPLQGNMCSAVTRRLDPTRFRVIEVRGPRRTARSRCRSGSRSMSRYAQAASSCCA